MDGTEGERRAPAQAGDEDQDEDQQGGGGQTGTAQTGEAKRTPGAPDLAGAPPSQMFRSAALFPFFFF